MQKSRLERQLAQIFPPLSAEGESSASGFGNRPIREGSMPNLVPYSIEFPKTPLTSPQQLHASVGNFASISRGTSSPQHEATNAVSVETIPDNPLVAAPENNGIEIQVSGAAIDSGENIVAEVDQEEDANDESILAKQNNHIFNSMMIDELLKRTRFSCEFEFRTASGSQFQNWTHIRDSKFLLSAVINEQGMLEIQACHTPPEQTSNDPPAGNKWAIRNTYNADSQCLTIIISGIIEYTYMSPLIGKFENPISLFSFSLNDRKVSIKNGGNEDEEINQRCCPFSGIKFDTPATGEFHITAVLSPKYVEKQSKNDHNSMGTAQIGRKNTDQKNVPTKQPNGKSMTTGNNATLRNESRKNGNRTEHSKRSETHPAVGARQNRAEESKIATQLGINTPAPTQEKILADESSNTLRHVGILNSDQAKLLPMDKSPDLQKVLENLYKGTEEIRKRINGDIPPETSPKKIRLGADKQLINETEKFSDSEDSSDSNYSEDESSFGEHNARYYQAMSCRKNEKCGVSQSHCLEKMLLGQNLFRVNCWICGQMWHTVCLTGKNVAWSEQKKKKLRCCGERKSKDVTRAIETPFDVLQKAMASSGVPRLTDDRIAGTSRATEEVPVNFMGNPVFSVQQVVTPTTSSNSGSTEPTPNTNAAANTTQHNLFASTGKNGITSSNTNKDNACRQHNLNQNSTISSNENTVENNAKFSSLDSRISSDVTLPPHTRELHVHQDKDDEDIDVVNVTPPRTPVPSPNLASVEEQVKPQKPQTDDLQGHRDAAGLTPQVDPRKFEDSAKKPDNPGDLTSNPEQSPPPLLHNEDMVKDAAILVRPQIQKIGQEEPVKDTVNLEKMVVPSNLQQVKERVVKKEIAVIVQKRTDSQEEPERKVTAQKLFKTEKIAPQKTSLQHPSKVMAKKKLARSPDSDEESDEDVPCSSSRKRWSSSSSDSLYEKVKKRKRKSVGVTENIGKPIRPRAAKGKPPVVDASSSEEDRHSEGEDEDRSNWCPSFNSNCLIGNRRTDDIWMECDTCHKWWHAFCIRLENKAYKNAFNCCHGEYLNRAQDSLNGTTKKKWLQIQKEQARKK
ncbi:hypothetical protein B9Z55_026493 [Caenorhabditis nigoni]|uniref:Zinc finger PHD-type domain-containing protein n=1 Tax=Caenorhabditis nigoni TaxID=1611254 RepID=A0A2G5T3I5_9PELO|nr:hypothetical protein B9Z55_026493 [Caenorhabditis nigoni]